MDITMEASMAQLPVSLKPLFSAFDNITSEEQRAKRQAGPQTAIVRHFSNYVAVAEMNGLRRLQLCRKALDALDRRGLDRSFHQRLFHEEYLKSCARIFFKRDGPGAFARSHARLLEMNGWDSTPQEILISTPRRFGKTYSVSMFAAAIMYACPNTEVSIYSTCKRISQKLLRNVVKFLELIFVELHQTPHRIVRLNQEEVHIRGNEGLGDLRVINSYPSKIGTTKGTGGDIIILEEAAYVDPGFFYETVAPLLLVGVTSLLCISTLTSDINFYTRLFKIRDPVTGLPIFAQLQVTLACEQCKEDGKAAQCKHMLHLVPRWQSSVRHERLRAVMVDRPDLIQSELSGLAFDALQQCFRTADIDALMTMPTPPMEWKQEIFIIIDPAAGGPQSDFALLSMTRHKGLITVRHRASVVRTR